MPAGLLQGPPVRVSAEHAHPPSELPTHQPSLRVSHRRVPGVKNGHAHTRPATSTVRPCTRPPTHREVVNANGIDRKPVLVLMMCVGVRRALRLQFPRLRSLSATRPWLDHIGYAVTSVNGRRPCCAAHVVRHSAEPPKRIPAASQPRGAWNREAASVILQLHRRLTGTPASRPARTVPVHIRAPNPV